MSPLLRENGSLLMTPNIYSAVQQLFSSEMFQLQAVPGRHVLHLNTHHAHECTHTQSMLCCEVNVELPVDLCLET